MADELPRCESTLEMADDFGDNSVTYRCELPKGHDGQHRESGTHENTRLIPRIPEFEKADYVLRQIPYVFYWSEPVEKLLSEEEYNME